MWMAIIHELKSGTYEELVATAHIGQPLLEPRHPKIFEKIQMPFITSVFDEVEVRKQFARLLEPLSERLAGDSEVVERVRVYVRANLVVDELEGKISVDECAARDL